MTRLTRADLLAPVDRWTDHRKETLILGIRQGVITVSDACKAHRMSLQEILNLAAVYQVGLVRGPAHPRGDAA